MGEVLMTEQDNHKNTVTAENDKSLRKDFRALLSSIAHVKFEKNADSWIEMELVNLSFGGVKIRMKKELEPSIVLPGKPCRLKFSIKGKEQIFPGHIIWVCAPCLDKNTVNYTRMGIQFDELTFNDKAGLLSMFIWNKHIKNSQDTH